MKKNVFLIIYAFMFVQVIIGVSLQNRYNDIHAKESLLKAKFRPSNIQKIKDDLKKLIIDKNEILNRDDLKIAIKNYDLEGVKIILGMGLDRHNIELALKEAEKMLAAIPKKVPSTCFLKSINMAGKCKRELANRERVSIACKKIIGLLEKALK